MNKKRTILWLFVVILGMSFLFSLAQMSQKDASERAQWEGFLKTARIVGEKQLGSGGVETAPWRLDLEKDGTSRGALWKNQEGKIKGYDESWKWEIAAYRLDKHLGLNMIPPTVEREFRGTRGACQLWVTAEMDLRRKIREKTETPSDRRYAWNNAIYLIRAFDNLIANIDRHYGNILITKDWSLILIDHSRSFGATTEFTSKLDLPTEDQAPEAMRRLPRAFVEKLKALNIATATEVVGDYLTGKEVQAVLARRDSILKEIARLVEKYGEDDVLY